MEVVSRCRNVQLSPQKARLAADLVRGKKVEEALNILNFSLKKSALVIKKVLESVISNAEHNNGVDSDDLEISSIYVDQGRLMKRMRPRAKGRADRILKRSCHITIKVKDN